MEKEPIKNEAETLSIAIVEEFQRKGIDVHLAIAAICKTILILGRNFLSYEDLDELLHEVKRLHKDGKLNGKRKNAR